MCQAFQNHWKQLALHSLTKNVEVQEKYCFEEFRLLFIKRRHSAVAIVQFHGFLLAFSLQSILEVPWMLRSRAYVPCREITTNDQGRVDHTFFCFLERCCLFFLGVKPWPWELKAHIVSTHLWGHPFPLVVPQWGARSINKQWQALSHDIFLQISM